MNIQFPPYGNSGIANFVYWLVSNIMSWGWVSYGFAIVFFTLFIKLILSPLDFANRFLTRKSQIQQQALANEVADLQQTYADDPLAFTRARQELFRKNGVGGLGSTLISLISVIVTLTVFINVMNALNDISHYNIYRQYEELNAVYQEYKGSEQLDAKLNETYQQTTTSFGWIKNIWQPDNFWTSAKMSVDDYNATQPNSRKLTTEQQKADYNAMYEHINAQKGGNGFMLLMLLAGATSFLSFKLSTMMSNRNAPKKEPAKQPEPIITYSLRDARQQNTNGQPAVDPAQVGKMMQWIMPVILMMFALLQTSAFAIYMIASSLVSTALTLLFGWLVDLILKHMKKPVVPTKDFDATIINPHAKYFKGGKGRK